MAKINIGNRLKEIPNNIFTNCNSSCVDPGYWYSEIFGKLPVYKCTFRIHRYDEDDDSDDIYTMIFNELIDSGDYTPIDYEYGNDNDKETEDSECTSNGIYTERFVLVSNTEPIMVCYSYGDILVMSHLGMDIINGVVDKYIRKYDQKNDKVKCYIIARDTDMYLEDFEVKVHDGIDFDMYNDGFEDVHKEIVRSIKEDDNGLYLLYGMPGTGKTTYIRHIIKECENKKRKFVYVPSNLFGDFTDPAFLTFLLDNRGCVFIIEDCESLVTLSDGMRSEEITNLLNMTDGLLGDALNIKIICTFNTDDNKIDEALLRPGRCRAKYEFNLLDKNKANIVAEKYGLNKIDKDITLAELFNPDKTFVEEKRKKIGFR